MQKNEPSLLSQSNKTLLRFRKIKKYRFIDLIELSASNLLTRQFVRDHIDELQIAFFQFEVQNHHKKWRIIKQFRDFVQLRQSLRARYEKKLLSFPVKTTDGLFDKELQQMLSFLTIFLQQLGKDAQIVQERVFTKFVNNLVPTDKQEMKVYYQVEMSKKGGGRHSESGFQKLLSFLASWNQCYFTISGEGIHFTQSAESSAILDHLIFSTTFSFIYGPEATGYQYGIAINSSHRVLQMEAKNVFDMVLFLYFLGNAIAESKNLSVNRFDSFAPIQNDCESKYYIDGQDYFSDLCDSLLAAKKEIFMAGWMISPYFELKRIDRTEQYRFDRVIAKIANSGIKINILLFNCPTVALNIDSEFSRKYLTSLSQNIRVLMHPNYVLIPFMWSHHQKMVIVDQKVAFMGGLDIAYGRMDTKKHLLTDRKGQFWPGVDYCNYRITDIQNPKQFRQCSIDREKDPRMPWHDIGVRLVGGSVCDLSRHFIQYWNYVNFQLNMDDRQLLTYVGLSEKQRKDYANQQQTEGRKITAKSLIKQSRKFIGSAVDQIQNLSLNFFNLQINEQTHKSESANFQVIAQQDVNRVNRVKAVRGDRVMQKQHQMQMQFYASHIQENNRLENLFKKIIPMNLRNQTNQANFAGVALADQGEHFQIKTDSKMAEKHQILRSASMWSLGLEQQNTESSILNAYIKLIQEAKEFIYIQNQFFISVDNKVSETICQRIERAYKLNQRFRVVVILPALPGFEGHPADENAAVFRVQIHLLRSNINKILERLQNIKQINEYIYFFSLRTHSLLNNKPVTEIIYVHSKLMIVDDQIALIGSANINDRSLNGNRDTELAVVIEQTEPIVLKIDQTTRLVGRFAHLLRKQLYMQHFGLSEDESLDYFNDQVWTAMIESSKKNHLIYRELFGCYPDNEMQTFQDIQKVAEDADPSRYSLLCTLIKGQAIPFQNRFLALEDLSLSPNQKEYFIPQINFT